MDKSKKKRPGLFAVLLFLLFFTPSLPVSAADPLDEIQRETIWIDVQEDGSLDMTYEIDWKVLDSTSDGPLTWVKIGIPNDYVEDPKALSGSIDEINYYESDGDYVRLNLDREYEAGETVNMKFSIHQHRMYEERSDGYKYEFTPGWFDEIAVRELKIFWKYDRDTKSTMPFDNGTECYLGEYHDLAPGERVSVEVLYPAGAYSFCDDYEESAKNSVMRTILIILAAGLGSVGFIIYTVILFEKGKRKGIKESYEKNRGLGSVYTGAGRSGRRASRGAHGGGCACACACACAGGGRAGCSRKDFFQKKISNI